MLFNMYHLVHVPNGTVVGVGKQDLLEQSLAYVRAHGFANTTLRQLAEGVGSSHRMLLYHFGSREGLLAALVDAIESAERAATDEIFATASSEQEAAHRAWDRLRAPERAADERLFYELAALTAQGVEGTERFKERFIGPWLDVAGGSGEQRAQRRADVALMRGLVLDLLVTGDAEGVDAAFEAWLAMRVSQRVAGAQTSSS